jgi:hypothetical protein
VVTTNLNRLARALLPVVAKVVPLLNRLPKGTLAQVPQTPISLNAFVTHGAISKLTFDPGQFSKSHRFSLPIVASFARSGPAITAPVGATPITLVGLLGLVHASRSSHPDYVPVPSPTPIAATGL